MKNLDITEIRTDVTLLIKLLDSFGIVIDEVMKFFKMIKDMMIDLKTSNITKTNNKIGKLIIHKEMMNSLFNKGLDYKIYNVMMSGKITPMWLKNADNIFVAINKTFLTKVNVSPELILGNINSAIKAEKAGMDFLKEIGKIQTLFEIEGVEGVKMGVGEVSIMKYAIRAQSGELIAILGMVREINDKVPLEILDKKDVERTLAKMI